MADYNNSRVQKFTSAGVYVCKWNSYGNGGLLSQPIGVATDAAGNVFVAEYSSHRISKFGPVPGVSVSGGTTTSVLELEPVRPNPWRGERLKVTFTLASSASARLELLDVSGRCIRTREVGSRAAGRQTLDFVEDGVRPGLYFLRITQGATAAVRRVAVLD